MSDVKVFEATRSGPNSRRRVKSTGFQAPERIRVAAYVRVSTDDDEQLGSFESQKSYYEDKIRENKEWAMAGIFADEAITGTNVNKREQFLEMIDRCMAGEIDMILTKSISRFARNTLDTLNYVRMLKDKNIAVIFEKENIDTLTMNGELMLTILSSLAQQEVESLSSNVKMGLAMKMQRGEMVGFNGCLGYDYHPEDKSMTINPDEADTVRMIFDLYVQGYGAPSIARLLTEMGRKNKKGQVQWLQSGVIGVIKNEKYTGDLLMGKTFTVDPIGKRRIANMGEEKMYLTHNHHEPIVSREIWEKAQEIRLSRSQGRIMEDNGMRECKTRQYTFSSMCECGFCGHKLSRRTRQQTRSLYKPTWHCINATKNGIASCPNCKSVDEAVLESAFLDVFRQLTNNYDDVLDAVIATVEKVIGDEEERKRLKQIAANINKLESKKSRLTELLVDGTIEKEEYDGKMAEYNARLNRQIAEKEILAENSLKKKSINRRIRDLRHTLETKDPLDQFDRLVFDSIVEKIIVGGYDSEGKPSPCKLTFVLKADQKVVAINNRERYKEKQKEIKRRNRV